MAKKRNRAAPFRFKPFSPKQKKLLTWWTDRSPYCDYDMVIADGAIRSGKTVAGIDSFFTWSLYNFENESFILSGKSMGALKRNVLKPAFQMLAAKGIPYNYNRSENYIEIGSNTYYCFGANNEASQDVLQGLTAAGAYADEVALFPQNFVEQMIGRCSVDGSKIFVNCNPGGPYHYLKTDYIDKSLEKRILRLHFTLDDNFALSQKIKERYKRMFTGVFYKRYILGLRVMAEGAIYDMWNDELHAVDTIPRRFDNYFIGVDYATGNPTVFLLIGQTGNKFYVIDEYYWDSKAKGKQKTDSEYSKDFKEFIKGIPLRGIFIDPSAASFIAQLKRDNVRGIRDADNSVIDGIRNVATLINSGRLFVYRKNCPNILKEFASYSWDPKAQERGEDKPIKAYDHALDALRYVIQSLISKNIVRAYGSKPVGF